MTKKKDAMSPQVKALKTTNLSPMIRMSNLMVPRMVSVFLPKLNEKQRKAFDSALPVGGTKKFYCHLLGTPTPPIVIGLAQPLSMNVLSEEEVRKQKIKGIRLNIQDLQVLTERKMGKALWRLKGQLGTILGLSGTFLPFLFLGPREIKDMQRKAMTHFKPLLDMMPK
jgi:hypothetical protein